MGANDVAISPDGQVAYVANADGTVTPIATATGIAGTPIQTGTSNALGIAITPDGTKAVVLSDNFNTTITTIDLTTNPPTPGPPGLHHQRSGDQFGALGHRHHA